MKLIDIINPALCFTNIAETTKKRLIETASVLIAEQVEGLSAEQIFESLLAREQLGSTGIGGGIAIPHCRVPRLRETLGCLMYLAKPMDFDAIDNQDVDLIFILLVPENTLSGHLETLKEIAEIFSIPANTYRLRSAKEGIELYQILRDLSHSL
jgi:PTS system nitrogen regulatory IIA component